MHELRRLWRKELSPPVALGLPMKRTRSELRGMHVMVLCILAFIVFVPRSRAQAPVFEITPVDSWIIFHVKSSVKL